MSGEFELEPFRRRTNLKSFFAGAVYETMSMGKLLMITEANDRVASGHLMECLVCRQYLTQMGVEVDLLINDDMPFGLRNRIRGRYYTYQCDIQKETDFLLDFLNDRSYTKLVFNLRKIENDFLLRIRDKVSIQIVCIDEFGNRRLDADIIINPMIDKQYWKYDTDAELYCGAEYLVLSMELQGFREKEKEICKEIKKVTVSMGGADIGNTTLRLAEWLPLLDCKLEINLVLGGAYSKEKELRELIRDNDNIEIFQNISYLNRLFVESDLVFCAGGNTLHELAVMGIPTIVIPSMPHEVQNGKAFETSGFALCGSIAEQFTYQELKRLYRQLEAQAVRMRMHDAGKRLADGRGYERIYRILSSSREESIR